MGTEENILKWAAMGLRSLNQTPETNNMGGDGEAFQLGCSTSGS